MLSYVGKEPSMDDDRMTSAMFVSQSMTNFQIPTHQSFGYRYVKDHEGEGGRQVDEPGDHEGVGAFDQFFSTWFSRPP